MSETETPAADAGPRTAEHDKLNPFEGEFGTEVKLWMGQEEPMISTGTMVNDWVLGGRYLRQTFKGDPIEVEGEFGAFEGAGYWGYDPSGGVYQGFWIDNASSTMQMETGTVDASGKVWTMTSELINPQNGEAMTKRTVITLIDDDHHRMESYFADGSGNEFKTMEINYVRKS